MATPLLLASHLVPALSALATGAWIVGGTKGTTEHKRLGKIWVGLMLITALTSFNITGGPLAVYQGYSYIHALSVIILFAAPLGFLAARYQFITVHRVTMISLYIALCVTGVLAVLMKGRFLNNLML